MTLTHSITLQLKPLEGWQGELIILPGIFSEKPNLDTPGNELGDLRLLRPTKKGAPNHLLLSLGKEDKVDLEGLRKAGGILIKWLVKNRAASAGISLESLKNLTLPIEESVNAFSEGILLGGFQYVRFKSEAPENEQVVIDFLFDANMEDNSSSISEILQQATHLTAAVNLSRSWAHDPPNVVNPITLAERVGRIASKENLKFTVIDDKQLNEIGANAILSVGKGSQTPSRLIILEYPGQGDTSTQPVVLVGKAITFDTGGYSLKERAGMVGMKYDKSAGMTVVATLIAAARLKLQTPIVGIIAAAENMVSGTAYRPNDILVTLSGKTVEVISADAEGRLVLCDALTYAQKHFKPSAMIDLATLTGGVVVALGKLRAGIMGNDQGLADLLIQSGNKTHERLWQLPLDDEYLDLIKGDDSDLKNSGAREAHAIIGGIFLKQFVSADIPWAHLDIAGVADTDRDMPYCPKGATGFGVRLLIDFLRNRGN